MKIRSALIVFCLSAAASGSAFAGNFASCLLETMPGTQSGPAFSAGMALCAQKHPDQLFTINRGSGRSLFSFKTANACTADKAKTTSWQPAAHQIRRACECLYSESRGEWDMCQRYELPQEIRQQYADIQSVAATISLEHHYRRIYAAHPDADELFSRSDFQTWWSNDPARKKVLMEGSTKQIIKLMSDFKKQLASSSAPWGEMDTIAPPSYR